MALPFDDELTQFLAQNIWLDPLLLPSKFPLPTELITPPSFAPPPPSILPSTLHYSPPPITTTATTTFFSNSNNNNNNNNKSTKNKSHNAIERRYRNNINERIAELKAAVPALQHTRQAKADENTGSSSSSSNAIYNDEDSEEYVDGVAVASKINKATIMRKATEYIVHLQHTNDQLKRENQILEQLVQQLPGGIPILTRYRTMKIQQLQRKQQEEDDLQEEEDEDDQHQFQQQRQHQQQQNTFMALFMCLSFSMDQNITSTTAHALASSSSSSSSPPSFDIWAFIRGSLLVICLVFLLYRRHQYEKQSTLVLLCSLAVESIQLVIRHTLGWSQHHHQHHEQEAERWIDIHANPSSSPLLRLYACVRMINLACPDQLTYVYACAAMQFYPYSTWISRHFWRLAMYETDDDMLVWDVHQQPPCEDAMLDSQAWKEAVERGADLDELSRLHLLDNLRTELGRLIISVTSSPPPVFEKKNSEEEQTAFERILYNNDDHHEQQQHSFPRWLAAVGATVEALWQSDVAAAERAVAVIEHEKDLLKVKIKLVLQAAIRLQQGDLTGIELLNETDALQKKIKKLLGYRRPPRERGPVGLEGETMALAEFVACLAGLHAWIEAWRLGVKASEQIKAQTLVLRRMMRCSTLEKLPAHQVLVDRLSRLGYFVSPNGSDDEEDDYDDDNDDEQTRPAKALDILRGLA